MKKLGLMLLTVGVTVGLASSLWAQSAILTLNYEANQLNPSNNAENLMFGTTVLIMASTNVSPVGTDSTQAYFAGAGDSVLSLSSDSATSGFTNPSIYWADMLGTYPTSVPMGTFDLSSFAVGTELQIFARIISNTVGNAPYDIGKAPSFDANGNFVHNAEGNTDLSKSYYFDTVALSYVITDNPSPLVETIDIPLVTAMGDWSEDGALPYTWTPVAPQAVPEPGAMMLMASGMLLLVRKIKK